MSSLCIPMPLIFIYHFLSSSFQETDMVLQNRSPQGPSPAPNISRDWLTLRVGTKQFG
jgi:hypothetical protein